MNLFPIFYHGSVESCSVSTQIWTLDELTAIWARETRDILDISLVGGIFIDEEI